MKSTTYRTRILAALTAGAFLFSFAGFSFADSIEERKEDIQKMRSETLEKLYKAHPFAKDNVQKAVGYAVFSNIGINLILLSAAGGSGVAHDNTTGEDTYMKMISGGVGFGFGVKDFRGIFLFSSTKAFKQFIDSGWAVDAQADAAIKSGDKGAAAAGAIAVAPDVYLYQLTETGLALQATIQGTKYFKDDELNKKQIPR
jgi:lipid-binding SYLF domain-containing protein